MDTTPKQVTGVDVSDRFSTFCTVDEAGEIEEEGRVRTSPQAFRTHFQKSPRRVVIEVGTHSPWMSRLLAPPISLDSRLAATTGSRERGCFDVSQAWGVESDQRS